MPRRSPRSTLFPYTTLFRSATLGRTRGKQTPGRTARTETSGVSLRADPGSCGDRVGKPVAPIHWDVVIGVPARDPAQRYEGTVTILENRQHGPQACFNLRLSYPPIG